MGATRSFGEQYYEQLVVYLLGLLGTLKERSQKTLRGRAIECLVQIAKAVGKDKFRPQLKSFVETLYLIQEHELDPEDTLRPFLLAAWEQLCMLFATELSGFLETLLPSILKLARKVPGLVAGATKPSSQELAKLVQDPGTMAFIHSKAQAAAAVEKEDALSLVSQFVEQLGPELGKYLEPCAEILVNVLEYSSQSSLKKTAALSLKTVVMSLKRQKDIDLGFLAKITQRYLQALMQAAHNETDVANIEIEATVMRDLLVLCGLQCFDSKALLLFFEHVLQLLSNSNRRIMANNTIKESQSLNEDDFRVLTDDNTKEDSLQVLLAELLGALFKTHPNDCVSFVPVLYPDLLREMLKPIATNAQRLFALTVIVSLIEHLTVAQMATIYPNLVESVIAFSNDADPKIRRLCLFGIGAVATSAGEYYGQVAENCYWALRQAIESPISEQVNRKAWRAAQDNAVSSLGKLIYRQGQAYGEHLSGIVTYWLRRLPIREDVSEARKQAEILAEMLLARGPIVAGTQGENIGDLLRIFGEVLETEFVDESSAEKISRALNQLTTVPLYFAKIAELAATLPPAHKLKLEHNLKLIHS